MRRGAGGRFRGGVLRAALCLGTLALFAAGPAPAFEGRAVDLSAEFREAIARFNALLARPDRAEQPELWDAAELRFRAILNTDPGGARADEAAFMVGEVNYQRHRLLRERRYLDAAIAAYRRVLDSYRFSSRGGDALVRLADIHYDNLNDSRRAYLLYRRAARDYPDTDASRRARVRMVALNARFPQYASLGDAARDPAAASPRASRPLPSPGAILGGREAGAGRRRAAPVTPKRAPDLPGSPPDGGAIPPKPEAEKPPKREHAKAEGKKPRSADAPHPLLEEGPIPLRSPSEDLPSLRSLRPRS